MPLGYTLVFGTNFSFKNEMNIFSGTPHSIALLKSYKTVYVPASKKIGHLRNTRSHYNWVMIFAVFTSISLISTRRLRFVIKLITYLESAQKTESAYVCFKFFLQLFFRSNFSRFPEGGQGVQIGPKKKVVEKNWNTHKPTQFFVLIRNMIFVCGQMGVISFENQRISVKKDPNWVSRVVFGVKVIH